jgi:hypothetical protein
VRRWSARPTCACKSPPRSRTVAFALPKDSAS